MKPLTVAMALLIAGASAPALSQQTITYQQAMGLYQKVISGQRSLESLSQQEREAVLIVARVSLGSCSSHSQKCQAICEAADQLKNASEDLARCAGNHDYNDSCDSKFREVRDAHDDLENAVSEASGDCE